MSIHTPSHTFCVVRSPDICNEHLSDDNSPMTILCSRLFVSTSACSDCVRACRDGPDWFVPVRPVSRRFVTISACSGGRVRSCRDSPDWAVHARSSPVLGWKFRNKSVRPLWVLPSRRNCLCMWQHSSRSCLCVGCIVCVAFPSIAPPVRLAILTLQAPHSVSCC